jgi:hypothetical protein
MHFPGMPELLLADAMEMRMPVVRVIWMGQSAGDDDDDDDEHGTTIQQIAVD